MSLKRNLPIMPSKNVNQVWERGNKKHRGHRECQVTRHQIFLERQQWKAGLQSLQDQIDTLNAWRMPNGLRNPKVDSSEDSKMTTEDSNVMEHTQLDSALRPKMPSDHPLAPFMQECIRITNWDSRTKCGDVRRLYDNWWDKTYAGTTGQTKKKMHHLQFPTEMKKYFKKTGTQRRSYYIGIEIPDRADPEEGESLPHDSGSADELEDEGKYESVV
jgi:hypothetical protein